MLEAVDLRTLFWKNAAVTLRKTDRDESAVELNIRLLAGYGSSEAIKMVRLYIYSDADASFLYSLDIEEQHFGRIRDEENLLVDFAGFAEKVTWLLDQCCGGSGGAYQHHQQEESSSLFSPARVSRFRAVLQVAGAGAGALRLVESNAFKELPHLTLHMRAGTDSTVKQFLAFRLNEVKLDFSRVAAALEAAERERSATSAELQQTQMSAATAAQEHSLQAQHDKTQVLGLQKRLEAAEAAIETLTAQLASARAEHAAAEERCALERAEARHLKDKNCRLEGELAECRARLRETCARAEGAEAAAARVAQRCQGFEAALQQAESRIEECKAISAGHETRAAAAVAENLALQRSGEGAAREAAALQEQLQHNAALVSKAEKEIVGLRAALAAAEAREVQTCAKMAAAESSAACAHDAAAASSSQLEDAKKKLESGEKMVAWLNKQLTAAQLQAGGGGGAGGRQQQSGSAMPTPMRFGTPHGLTAEPQTPGGSWKPPAPSAESSGAPLFSSGKAAAATNTTPLPQPIPHHILLSSSSSVKK